MSVPLHFKDELVSKAIYVDLIHELHACFHFAKLICFFSHTCFVFKRIQLFPAHTVISFAGHWIIMKSLIQIAKVNLC